VPIRTVFVILPPMLLTQLFEKTPRDRRPWNGIGGNDGPGGSCAQTDDEAKAAAAEPHQEARSADPRDVPAEARPTCPCDFLPGCHGNSMCMRAYPRIEQRQFSRDTGSQTSIPEPDRRTHRSRGVVFSIRGTLGANRFGDRGPMMRFRQSDRPFEVNSELPDLSISTCRYRRQLEKEAGEAGDCGGRMVERRSGGWRWTRPMPSHRAGKR